MEAEKQELEARRNRRDLVLFAEFSTVREQ